ncbi:MAG TPA: hypothetical protein H9902_14790 [Candidatus Stackebrandtia faecavium]|nr:hypothetical protein [Candidatus Stackebrandtia faecavium]
MLLAAGVATGIHIGVSDDSPSADPRQLAQEDIRETDQQQTAARDWHREYVKLAADEDAEEKAESIAQVAGDQAKALDDTYEEIKAEEEAEEEKEKEDEDTPDVGPIPSDCDEYSGNRAVGCARLLDDGFGLDQMPCLDKLWTKESGWNHKASNPSSGAYGIPQALPGSKMGDVASDWETNPSTQVIWGLGYIKDRYGDPCGAWEYSQNNGYY